MILTRTLAVAFAAIFAFSSPCQIRPMGQEGQITHIGGGGRGGIRIISTSPQWFRAASRQRIDVVMLGDSNQILSGHGWDHGIQHALAARYPMYATGLVSLNDGNNSGSGVGYEFAAQTGLGAVSGAPAELGAYLDTAAISPHDYGYLSDAETGVASSSPGGIILQAACPIGVGGPLTFSFIYGTFPSGTGSFRPGIRSRSSFLVLGMGDTVNPVTGSYGTARVDVSLAANPSRSEPMEARFAVPGQTDVQGPFFGLWSRAENTSRTYGFAGHTLLYRGGAGARIFATEMEAASDAQLTLYFSEVRRLQGNQKRIIVIINTGLNDRGDSTLSVGPSPAASNTAAGYLDNITAIIQRIDGIFTANEWSTDELKYVVIPSHVTQDAGDGASYTSNEVPLNTFRDAAKASLASSRIAVVDMRNHMTAAEAVANGWYLNAVSDHNHLTQTAYEVLAGRIIGSLDF